MSMRDRPPNRKRRAQGKANRPPGSTSFTKAHRIVDDTEGHATAAAAIPSTSHSDHESCSESCMHDCMHEIESDSEAAPELVEQDVGRPWLAAGATHKDWFGCVEEDDPYQSDSDSDMEEEDDEREVERDRVQAEMGAKEIEEGEAKAAAVQWGASVQLWGEDFYGTFMDVAAAAAASRDKGERERRLATLRQQKRRAAQKAHDVKSAAAATRVGGLLAYGFQKTTIPTAPQVSELICGLEYCASSIIAVLLWQHNQSETIDLTSCMHSLCLLHPAASLSMHQG